MIPGLIFLILIFSFILIKAADSIIIAVRRLSKQTHTKLFTLSAIILAIGTSLPEMSVGITSALEGNPSLSLGAVTGSNIANIALVGGIASLFAGKVTVRGTYLKRDLWIAMVAGLLPMLFLLDSKLSRVDGLVLLSVYGAYAFSFFRRRYAEIAHEQQEESYVYRFLRRFNHIDARRRREIARLFIGVAVMLFAADTIVKLATQMSELMGLPSFVVGVVLVAIGTSLPELAFSFRALNDHHPSMFFGNLLGSTIANSTLVIGLVSVISPFEVVAVHKYFIAYAFFLLIYISFLLLIRTKHRLDRWESVILILLYLVFVVVVIF